MKIEPSDGRIVVAGSNGSGGNFAVLRYNPDGSQDSGFGTAGVATADFGGSDAAPGVAFQSDGEIVTAGGGGPNSSFALARFEGGGSAPPPPAGVDVSVTTSGPATVSIGDGPTYTPPGQSTCAHGQTQPPHPQRSGPTDATAHPTATTTYPANQPGQSHR